MRMKRWVSWSKLNFTAAAAMIVWMFSITVEDWPAWGGKKEKKEPIIIDESMARMIGGLSNTQLNQQWLIIHTLRVGCVPLWSVKLSEQLLKRIGMLCTASFITCIIFVRSYLHFLYTCYYNIISWLMPSNAVSECLCTLYCLLVFSKSWRVRPVTIYSPVIQWFL